MQGELTPAIVQDSATGRVLMLAWMDEEAERRTRETGEAWFWSRSREQLWRKGETSGNTLAVDEVRDDCDGDALLVRVTPAGPTCHTGSVSCFAPELWRTIAARAAERPAGSYTVGAARARRRRLRAQGGGGSGRGRGCGARRERRARRRRSGRSRLSPVRAARGARPGCRRRRRRVAGARVARANLVHQEPSRTLFAAGE